MFSKWVITYLYTINGMCVMLKLNVSPVGPNTRRQVTCFIQGKGDLQGSFRQGST